MKEGGEGGKACVGGADGGFGGGGGGCLRGGGGGGWLGKFPQLYPQFTNVGSMSFVVNEDDIKESVALQQPAIAFDLIVLCLVTSYPKQD